MHVESRSVIQSGRGRIVTLPNGMWKKGEKLVMMYDDKKVTYMREEDVGEYLNDKV